MTSYTGAGSSEDSPDRLDALVWAFAALSEYGGDCAGGMLSF